MRRGKIEDRIGELEKKMQSQTQKQKYYVLIRNVPSVMGYSFLILDEKPVRRDFESVGTNKIDGIVDSVEEGRECILDYYERNFPEIYEESLKFNSRKELIKEGFRYKVGVLLTDNAARRNRDAIRKKCEEYEQRAVKAHSSGVWRSVIQVLSKHPKKRSDSERHLVVFFEKTLENAERNIKNGHEVEHYKRELRLIQKIFWEDCSPKERKENEGFFGWLKSVLET